MTKETHNTMSIEVQPWEAKAAAQTFHRILGARHDAELLAGNLSDNLLCLPLHGKGALPSLRKGCASIAV